MGEDNISFKKCCKNIDKSMNRITQYKICLAALIIPGIFILLEFFHEKENQGISPINESGKKISVRILKKTFYVTLFIYLAFIRV